jgi:hypothetical protein
MSDFRYEEIFVAEANGAYFIAYTSWKNVLRRHHASGYRKVEATEATNHK